MSRNTQTNFRAEDFMVASTKDQPSGKKAAKKAAAAPAAPKPDEAPDGTTAEVLAWVGDDKARAQLAYDKELADEKPRKGVLEGLEEILTDSDGDEGDGEQ